MHPASHPRSIPSLHHIVWSLHVVDCVLVACLYCLGRAGRRVRKRGARWVRLRWCLPNCHVKPLTYHVLANRWLAMLPLCSAPIIALLVAGEVWRPFLVGTLIIVGISPYYLVYLNATIYLVKGGRLGLLPSVLFHSCRPSFRHIGVMFPEFVFLMQLGYNGNPSTVCLE